VRAFESRKKPFFWPQFVDLPIATRVAFMPPLNSRVAPRRAACFDRTLTDPSSNVSHGVLAALCDVTI
jgi:hypothetical protein